MDEGFKPLMSKDVSLQLLQAMGVSPKYASDVSLVLNAGEPALVNVQFVMPHHALEPLVAKVKQFRLVEMDGDDRTSATA